MTVTISLNGEARQLGDETTVAALVDAFGIARRGVAVAVNSEIVPRGEWGSTTLEAGDRVEVLHATQGGCT